LHAARTGIQHLNPVQRCGAAQSNGPTTQNGVPDLLNPLHPAPTFFFRRRNDIHDQTGGQASGPPSVHIPSQFPIFVT
jgi:hypothetical protein